MCPACGNGRCILIRSHDVTEAATHLISPRRSPERNARLQKELQALWGSDHVVIRRCDACGMWFADPFVAGTPTIYNLITDGNESYPTDRFEFGCTLRDSTAGGRLLEIGAGDGAFLRQARSTGRFHQITATEYDDGSVGRLRRIPEVAVYQTDIQQVAATHPEASFDCICMFQVLEHMDRIDTAFAAVEHLLAPRGNMFIAVPNPEWTVLQEEATRLWDMPPNHIGRWTREALDAAVEPASLRVVAHQIEDAARRQALWILARFRFRARGYDQKTIPGLADGIHDRRLRGLVKWPLTFWDAAIVAARLRGAEIPGVSQWFRVARVT